MDRIRHLLDRHATAFAVFFGLLAFILFIYAALVPPHRVIAVLFGVLSLYLAWRQYQVVRTPDHSSARPGDAP